MSVEAPHLVSLASKWVRLPHPEVVTQFEGSVFPVVRDTKKRGSYDKAQDIIYDDNTVTKWALLWSHNETRTAHPTGWTLAHVWSVPKDRDAYCHLANLCVMPEDLKSLSDKNAPLAAFLRYHAQSVYGWRPGGHEKLDKPAGFDAISWCYFEPVLDAPKLVIARLQKANSANARALKMTTWYRNLLVSSE
ncbi:hypothetical protein [Actibacterium sp. 188UL27-1]|uniref:hypothetical protein n=1 Tax=Actibacterium sp. 188UL27-1 TaxID=2786961 RepID=UPI001959CF8F|nr:hypothetical protein [Actibacterium sp. 188UL27-1]MBM7068351.1 hypothetical protein [Actibacterium sp. 188UL27-1]